MCAAPGLRAARADKSAAFAHCILLVVLFLLSCPGVQAQTFRFSLRAEPDVIPANGISTSSILVQVQGTGGTGIAAEPIVRFRTTSGIIEPQTRLTNGIARVLLRSSTTPGTAVITAFINNAIEQVAVEFSNEVPGIGRYLQVSGPYVSYGAAIGVITASGQCTLDYGDTHIESDVRLDVDLIGEKLWAEGGAGRVLIRHGKGKDAHELHGDRLFYDLRRRRGVMRRGNTTSGAARQEFMDSDFKPLPATVEKSPASASTLPQKPQASQIPQAPIQPVVQEKPAIVPAIVPAITAIPAADQDGVEPPEVKFAPISAASGDDEKPVFTSISALAGAAPPVLPRTAVLPDALNGKVKDPGNEAKGQENAPVSIPDYRPLQPEQPDVTRNYRLIEPLPPQVDSQRGYWVTSRRVRVFPHDKVQFERAVVFFNGARLFTMPLYVISLNGTFNPATDMVSLNTSGGLSLNMPYYYQASPRGTGTLYLQHAPGNGFSADKPGFALAVDQQYWLSERSQGNLKIDQIGRGGWNLNWDHRLQLSSTTSGAVYVAMPQHRNLYAQGSLLKQFKKMEVGLEGYFSKPQGGQNNVQGQFFARLQPRQVGNSRWFYTMTANLTALRRFTELIADGGAGGPGGSGGGIGLPGETRDGVTTIASRTRPLYGQTFSVILQAPQYKLWKGGRLQANLQGNAYNYSNGQRGLAPGLTVGMQQDIGRVGALRVDYNYDKGLVSPLGGSYYGRSSHFLSGQLALNLGSKIAGNALLSRSLSDGSLYGLTSLNYYFAPKWRAELFSDYSRFAGANEFLDYGVRIGRLVGVREVSVNWSRERNRIYFEWGNFFH